MRLTQWLFKGLTPDEFKQSLEQAAQKLGGQIIWNQPSSEGDLRLSYLNGVHNLYIPYLSGRESIFCRTVAELTGLPMIELSIQEGALWEYGACKGGEFVDAFNPYPEYWEDPGELTEEQWQKFTAKIKGNPQALADLWSIPVERIEKYIKPWVIGREVDEDEDVYFPKLSGKAYPTDKYEYGSYEQFHDVLAALGGEWPKNSHTLILPDKLSVA
jgi:hypothetical protein